MVMDVTQAGSVGNDAMGAFYLLASLHFGLKARRESRLFDVVMAVWAAALLTGIKASNLPLLLPCALPLLGLLPHIWRRWKVLLMCGLLGAGVSFLPIAVLNHKHEGDWTGDPQNSYGMKLEDPVRGLVGNAVLVTVGGFQPPLFPASARLNQWLAGQTGDWSWIKEGFPRFRVEFGEIPMEEAAGLGLGIVAIWAALLGLGWRRGRVFRHQSGKSQVTWFEILLAGSAWISVAVFAAKMGSESGARLLLPYYPALLLLPLLLIIRGMRPGRLVWLASLLAVLSSLAPLTVSPSRPLFPAMTLMGLLESRDIQTGRAGEVYRTYAMRWDLLGEVRDSLPDGVEEVGLIATADEPEVALWRPFGSRKVTHLSGYRLYHIEAGEVWVVGERGLREGWGWGLDDWLEATELAVVGEFAVRMRVRDRPERWVVVTQGQRTISE